DSAIMQLGGDLIAVPLGPESAVHAGLMAGYGSARTRADATLVRSGGKTILARADGKVSGYSVGLYGTAYQDSATQMGAYVDA
ncbi:autotransporter outer membrane beta-barrel domain-containing protein, partial [Pseudomonas sp. SIMBA_021]|uniref:autotransporter outer membrane beta-barrel domain-containing protein n=1 Tax=Pseudomonas sp. SIMBA_021 TaxID=3085767 RepID=UPI00397D47E9